MSPVPVPPLREMGKRGGRAASRRLKIGVIGFGKFGQFIAKTFVKDHDVVGMGRGDYTIPAKEMGAYRRLFHIACVFVPRLS